MKKVNTVFLVIIYFILSPVLFSQTGWYQQNTGTNLNINCIHFFNSNSGIAGADLGTILKTTNGGVNWSLISLSVFDPVTSVFMSGANIYLAGTNSKIFRTTNAGVSWDTTGIGGKKLSFINSLTGFSISGYKTPDAGGGWLFYGYLNTTNVIHTIFFTNENTGFGGSTEWSNPLYNTLISKTVNGGVSWVPVYSSSADMNYRSLYDIYFADNNNGYALEYFNSGSVCRLLSTGNGGNNWSAIELPVKMNSVKFANLSTGWMCGTGGNILHSTNGGVNWSNLYSPVTSELNQIYMVGLDTGYIAGSSGKILKTINGGITGLEPVTGSIPESFLLYQNYPNPFNPVTKIKYDIPAVGQRHAFDLQTKLVIYDILGREIAVLVNEQLQPGSYETEWSAAGGAYNFPSGVYYYRLTAGDYSETRKMILIK
jgi:photosystem II stability/assembly factor-like uncharacterized protein